MENGSFTPLVFSTTGSMSRATTIFYRKLAHLLSERRNQSYATTMGWLRCHLGYSLLKSAILCIRGSRSKPQFIPRFPDSTELTIRVTRTYLKQQKLTDCSYTKFSLTRNLIYMYISVHSCCILKKLFTCTNGHPVLH